MNKVGKKYSESNLNDPTQERPFPPGVTVGTSLIAERTQGVAYGRRRVGRSRGERDGEENDMCCLDVAERLGACDHFEELLRDCRLAGLVVLQLQ